MKINTEKKDSKRSRLRLFTIVLAIVFIAAIVLFILEKMKITDFIKLPQSNVEIEQKEAVKRYDEQKKQEFIEEKITPATPTTKPSSDPGLIELSVSQSNNSVIALTKLSAVPSGLCTITINNGEKTFTDTAQVIYQPEFSSCAGFSIPTSKLGAGAWSITVKVTYESDKAITKTVGLDVK